MIRVGNIDNAGMKPGDQVIFGGSVGGGKTLMLSAWLDHKLRAAEIARRNAENLFMWRCKRDPSLLFRTWHREARSFVGPSLLMLSREADERARADSVRGRVWTAVRNFCTRCAEYISNG